MSRNSLKNIFSTLADRFEPDQLITNPVELITYERDAALDKGMPDGVVLPHTPGDLCQIIRWSSENRVPIIPRGAGTGLAGGAVAEYGGLIVHFSRMNRILELNPLSRRAVVEPGVTNLELDTRAKSIGLYFPPDPASGRSSTIGGNVAANAGGPHCFKYGVTTNYVTGLEVVLADGQVMRLGGLALDYPEYDFTGILVGSEGTLALISKVFILLRSNPPGVKTLMASFQDVEDAGDAVSALIASGLTPATLEFMDQKMMKIIEQYSPAGLPVQAGAALIIEVDGYPQSLDLLVDEIIASLHTHHVIDINLADSEEERQKIWYGRKSAAGAMSRLAPAYLTLDGTVPRSKLAAALKEINRICSTHNLQVAYIFHAGDGNLHPFLLIEDPDNRELMKRIHQAGEEIMEICISSDGSITGEHGVGIEKRKFMPRMYSDSELSAMLDIKVIFDPHNILNPGKIFPGRKPDKSRTYNETLTKSPSLPAVISPRSFEEVVDLFLSHSTSGEGMVITGGGTKFSPPDPAHQLLTKEFTGIKKIAIEDRYVTVGAGTRLSDLQKELESYGNWIPLISPWEKATLGGMIAANFNAPLRLLYGGLRDLLLSATVVLPDGRTIRSGRPVVKNVAGYDLTRLFVGSWGTLGLILDVTLKIQPAPRLCTTLLVPVPDLSQAMNWCRQAFKASQVGSSILLCKGLSDIDDSPYLFVFTAEGFPGDVEAEVDHVSDNLISNGAAHITPDQTQTGSQIWGRWIFTVSESIKSKTNTNTLVRSGVSPLDISELITVVEQDPGETAFIADFGNGLLYASLGESLSNLRTVSRSVGGYTTVLFGSLSGSNPLNDNSNQPESISIMRKLKSRWDPQNYLNPGIFDQ